VWSSGDFLVGTVRAIPDVGIQASPSMQLSADHAYDHGASKCYDIIALHMGATGMPFKDALDDPARRAGIRPTNGTGTGKKQGKRRILATYDYPDRNGNLLFQVVRFEPKGFAQRRPDAKGDWAWNLDGVQRVIYRLPEVVKAGQVFIVEGEKDADNLAALGLCATTSPQGAGKWLPEYCRYLNGVEEAVVLPDNDDAGRAHAAMVARMLLDSRMVRADNVKILELPGLPPKGDVSDWLAMGGTKDELVRLVNQCGKWNPPKDEGTHAPEADQPIADLGPFTLDEVLKAAES
jgi:putative DNA primase/helicase